MIRRTLATARSGGSLEPVGPRASVLFGLAGALCACQSQQEAAAPPPPVKAAVESIKSDSLGSVDNAAPQAPVFTFNEPEPWKSRDGVTVVAPPDLNAETWRIMVNQTAPIQRKTPQWQDVPARATVELAMPPGSKFRCLVPPIKVSNQADDFGKRLEAWDFRRSFLCSSDGFRSWTETVLQVRVLADGTRKVGPEAGLLLRDRDGDGSVRETYVLMRSDKEKLHATQGPPQIVADRKLDD